MSGLRETFRGRSKLLFPALLLVAVVMTTSPSWAATKSGATGVQATVQGAPPTQAATIVIPANGAVFTDIPITVSGLCPTGLLIKIFSNNVFVGSASCQQGSYSLQISLFSGRNDLVARDYDALDQAGPDSNTVSVTFNDAQFLQFGTHVTLGSSYAQRGAPPGTELDWPVELSGGNGPYAISVDWGDGSPSDLFTATSAGTLTLKHTYKTAGLYKIIVKATDTNGGEAFLQLTGQATGAIQSQQSSGNNVIIQKEVIWWPALIVVPLILVAFWLGRRHELHALRKQFNS